MPESVPGERHRFKLGRDITGSQLAALALHQAVKHVLPQPLPCRDVLLPVTLVSNFLPDFCLSRQPILLSSLRPLDGVVNCFPSASTSVCNFGSVFFLDPGILSRHLRCFCHSFFKRVPLDTPPSSLPEPFTRLSPVTLWTGPLLTSSLSGRPDNTTFGELLGPPSARRSRVSGRKHHRI